MSPRSQNGDSKPKIDEPLDQPAASTSPTVEVTMRTITSLVVTSAQSTPILMRGSFMIVNPGRRRL